MPSNPPCTSRQDIPALIASSLLPVAGGHQAFDVARGKYAVSIDQDVNGNKSVNTDVIGVPTEQWGMAK